MKVTPLDLKQQRFKTVMRGFDRGEVTAFLTEAADDYEFALRDNDRLRQEMAKLEAALGEHRGQEKNLRNTLLTAQKLADEIKENAQKEAALVVREAEGRADLLLQKSQGRLEEVQREIDSLRLKRREVENSLEGIIATIQNTIGYVREQDARQREEKILLHRPRHVEQPRPAEPAPATDPQVIKGAEGGR
jgi:cell division initiation protein